MIELTSGGPGDPAEVMRASEPLTLLVLLTRNEVKSVLSSWKAAMDFEWDETKACVNEQKHGVSFLEAAQVFGDDHSSCVDDPDHSYDEDRYLLFGVSSMGNYLVVSYVERSSTIRIISARRMTRQERKAYEE